MRQQVTQQCDLSGVKMFLLGFWLEFIFFKVLAFDKAHKIKFALILT